MLTVKDLQEFEEEVASLYKDGKIKAPIHLRVSQDGAYERNLIDIFKNIKEEDYVLGYWAMHNQCLLKGVPRQQLLDEIIKGNSISLCFWDKYKILCSGIVSSLVGVATGLAWGLKIQRDKEEPYQWTDKHRGTVHLFLGDMAAQNGSLYEAVKYAWAHQLSIKFHIEDNGLSVMTDTEKTWGVSAKETYEMLNEYYPGYVTYFKYSNKFPHSGVSQRIKF